VLKVLDMNRCGRNGKDEKTIIHLINRDVSDDMKMIKEDIDGRREDCRCFTSMTYLKHCSFISYVHPVYIEGLMTGKVIVDAMIELTLVMLLLMIIYCIHVNLIASHGIMC
jgi:hypothetical protein